MGEVKEIVESVTEEEEEDARAGSDIWRYIFGFVEMAVVKCAIELGIADIIKAQGKPMTLTELSAALGCDSSSLYRIMRFLVHQKIFKEKVTCNGTKSYALTPISRLLIKHGERSMAALVLLQSSPVMLAPWQALSDRVREQGSPAFKAAHGVDIWEYATEHPEHSELINDAMACDATFAVPAIVEGCAQAFDGVGTVVDVGGGDGSTLRMLVKAFPSLKGLNFDLPNVVEVAPQCNNVEHVGGDMFVAVPKADAAFLKWVLHDWGDEECIQILKRCREAIPEDKGKVVIIEAVMEEKNDEHILTTESVGLMLDMVMMAHTNYGKERTTEEWTSILCKARFNRVTVHPIRAVQSVILAYP